MRLARPIYESVPLIYAAIGGIAIGVSYLDPGQPQTAISLAIGLVAEVAALTVFLRRQDCRALSRDYSGGTVDLPSSVGR